MRVPYGKAHTVINLLDILIKFNVGVDGYHYRPAPPSYDRLLITCSYVKSTYRWA